MAIRLHFWGADQTVTGSSHHIETAGQNVLLDCGLFQGRRQDTANINSHLALTPEQLAGGVLNAVVLSHAHIDHSGDLPLLSKQGYRGPIYTTPATIDLCAPMLKDSAHIQESDAEFLNKRRGRRAAIGVPAGPEPMQPLYGPDDAVEKGQKVRLLFSGDVGRKNLPIIRDPDPAPAADYLIMESTYGDRLHAPVADVKEKVATLVKAVLARGGHIIVPAF